MIEFFYILCILCFIRLLLPLGDVLFVVAWELSKLTVLFVSMLLSVAWHWLYGLLVFLFSIRITFVDASICHHAFTPARVPNFWTFGLAFYLDYAASSHVEAFQAEK
jgi:hypothetical protein